MVLTWTRLPNLPRLSLSEKEAFLLLSPIFLRAMLSGDSSGQPLVCPGLNLIRMQAFLRQVRLSLTTCLPRTASAFALCSLLCSCKQKCMQLPALASLGFSFYFAMAAPQTAQEALQAWLKLLSPEERREAQSKMGASLPASAEALSPSSLPEMLPPTWLPLPPAKPTHRQRLYPRSLIRSF